MGGNWLNVNRLIEIYPTGSRQKKKCTPANMYLFKVNHKSTSKRCVIDVVLLFLLLTLNIYTTFSSVSIVGFEQVNVGWDNCSVE